MYITISPQKLNTTYSQSVSDFVAYLEKENEGVDKEYQELFFNQYSDAITPNEVIHQIDTNTSKLKKTEPKFYSLTVSPSAAELKHLQEHPATLKEYTKELMKTYVSSFNREIHGKPITINDITYFAKIEHQRSYKGTDKHIRENQAYATQILKLKNEVREIVGGRQVGNIQAIQQKIDQLEKEAPHQLNGKRIVQGTLKPGNQSHIHIIVSRKDASNTVSLSPGSKYKASEVVFNGKKVKRGFDRDAFFHRAEKTFDNLVNYQRNYVASYQARKDYLKNPTLFFTTILGLPSHEKAVAFKLLGKAGVPIVSIPTSTAQITMKLIKKLKHTIDRAVYASSISI